MKTGIVYKATSPSGKCYIGKTIYSLKKRIWQHNNHKKCPAFSNALVKYGKDAFTWEVLHTAPEQCLFALEMIEIARHNCVSPNGYNLTYGGEGGRHSPETRAKLSRINKGKVIPPEVRAKISKSNARNMLGKKHSPESIAKISASKKAQIARDGHPMQGRKHTAESRANMSKGHKGRKRKPMSDETKRKIGNANRGRKHTKQSREKMSQGQLNSPNHYNRNRRKGRSPNQLTLFD